MIDIFIESKKERKKERKKIIKIFPFNKQSPFFMRISAETVGPQNSCYIARYGYV